MKEENLMNWHLQPDEKNILWLGFDRQGASVNTINPTVLSELNTILEKIDHDSSVTGLVIYSKKQNGFIAGADVQYISQLKDSSDIKSFIELGQQVFQKLARLKMPTVAMIDGFCMGGGLELSLACQYRVANEENTSLGLPEVRLGIQPGWGGSVRLPKLINIFSAMDLLLTGRTVDARAAQKIGLVDASLPKRQLKRAAEYYIVHKPKQHSLSAIQKFLRLKLIRYLLAKIFYFKTAQKINPDHYPAPFSIIRNWEKESNDKAAYAAEVNAIVSLISTGDTTKNLMRIFFLRERLKAFAKQKSFMGQHVHVIGAGAMGGDIAAWCVLQGLTVTLQDREPKYLTNAIHRAYQLFQKKLKRPRKIQAAMDRLIPDVEGTGIKTADVIIEAIYENLAAKQALFKTLESQAKPTALLATNTSSLPLEKISEVLQQPNRLVGVHFFNPVALMPLVEIVHGEATDPEMLNSAAAFVGRIDKLALPVKSSPGFLVNRILMPYLLEAVVLLQEGIPASVIDKAAVDFGMPMGPIELADTVGLDVCLAVAEFITQQLGGLVPQQLVEKVKQGHLGRKSGQGFYRYKNNKPIRVKENRTESSQDLALRLIERMVETSKICLKENVVTDADLVDAGMIFGAGFPPFRGGPMQLKL